ncbi:efflux RND transporter periplasmic adaptor subunit [Alteromonas flava]|uniref:efflux RND transporter periplasmic adaptor subunit n=1 Tax=Alteromonas flava TaxID=2048003 RepID=UPI000C2833B8|nr:efflux RND transporter periplasmic adaptor subunit [Alteromonas flava]
MRLLSKLNLSLLAFGLASTSFGLVAQDMPPAQVEVVTAERLDLAPSMQLKGNVVALQDAVISAEVEGRLVNVEYVGSKLAAGATLAQLDDARARWALSSRSAELAALKVDLEFRQSEVERFERLASQDNASKNQLQRERAAMLRIEQEIASADAWLQSAQRALDDTRVKAPFAGVIAQQFAHTGEYIRIGDPIVRYVNESLKDLSIPVPIRLLGLLSEGLSISVEHGDHRHDFPIRKIVPIGDPASRMAEIRLNVSDSHMIIGDSVTADIPVQMPESVVAVPRDALVIRGSQRFIYVVDSNDTAQQITANVRFADGPWVVLSEGVNAGDKVIIRGAERLQPQSKVSY